MEGNEIITGTGIFQGNPFPGSRPFLPSEDRFFFGREQAVREVLDKLLKNRFLTLLGASASGKTSLVLSGLIPALLADDSQEWVPVVIQPGEEPLQNLARGFMQVFPNRFTEEDVNSLVSAQVKLGDMIAEKGLDAYHYLLVVDQFEDLFTVPSIRRNRKKAGRSPESHKFVGQLIEAIETQEASIYVLLSLRSAFLTQSSAYRELTEYINKSKYLLPRMSREALLEVITEPIHQAGASVVPGFEQVLLEDLDDEAPLLHLQYALRRTWMKWKARHRPDQAVSTDDYLKGAGGPFALREQMEAAYQSLDIKGKQIAEKLFKALAFKDDNREAFSRPVGLGSVARIARCNMDEVHAVVRAFRRPGALFLTLSSKKVVSETRVSLAHDYLVEVWDRLDAWVEEEALSIKTYLQLSEYSLRYQQGKCGLLTGEELLEAMDWRVRQDPDPAWGIQFDPAFERAMVYLSTSEEEHMSGIKRRKTRELRRRTINRVMWISLSVIALAAVSIVLVVNLRPEREQVAERSPQRVDTERSVAADDDLLPAGQEEVVNNEVPAEELTGSTSEPGLQTEEGLSPGTDGDEPLVSSEEETRSRNVRRARRNQDAEPGTGTPSTASRTNTRSGNAAAEAQPDETMAAEPGRLEDSRNQESPVQGQNAIGPVTEAGSNLSDLDIIGDIALQSRELSGDRTLSGLLAYTSYLLNAEAGGSTNDRDIFHAMYEARKGLLEPVNTFYPGIPTAVKAMEWVDRTGSVLVTESGGGMRILSGNINDTRSQIVLTGTGRNNECMGLSPDERTAAIGTNGGGLLFIELENKGKVVHRSGDHGKVVLFIQNLGNSGSFLTAGGDNRILRWGYNSRESSLLLEADDRLSALATSRDGSKLVFGQRDGKLYLASVLDPGSREELADFGQNRVTSLSLDPSGRILAAGLLDGTLRLISMDSKRQIARLTGPASRTGDLKFSPNGRYLAAASNDGNVYLWSSSDWGQAPMTFSENNGYVLALCFSRNSQYFFSGSREIPKMVGRPTNSGQLARELCPLLDRNLTLEEWDRHIGERFSYRETCPQ